MRINPVRLTEGALAAATLLFSAQLIIQCAKIYAQGVSLANRTESGVLIRDIYSREIAAEGFLSAAWAAVLWLVVLVGTLFCKAIWREQTPKRQDEPMEYLLELYKQRTEITPAMLALEKKRERLKWFVIAVCSVCGAVICAYFFDAKSFASVEMEKVMADMLTHIVPWLALAFAALLAAELFWQRSLNEELALAKNAPKKKHKCRTAEKSRPLTAYRAVLFAVAAALLAAGVANGGMKDVFVKAVNICTECIGLG